ncbi:glycosyltransferase family 2 protein [Shewanella putrefaciens]
MLSNSLNGPLVSVIIPVYNHEKFLTDSIESVIRQTYKNIELIVIDDGSKDNSHNLLEILSAKYKFNYIHKENEGLSKTLKLGLSLCSGEYVAILASDDMWLPEKLEKQVTYLQTHQDCVALCTQVNVIDEHGNISLNNNSCEKLKRYDFNRIMLYGHQIPPASILIDRTKIESSFFDPSLKVEDFYLWLCLTENGGYIDVLPDVLAHYRIHSSNTTGNLALIAKYHHITLERFRNKLVFKRAKSYWSRFSFRQLTRTYKRESLKYIYPSIDFFFSKDFLYGILKLVFIWK